MRMGEQSKAAATVNCHPAADTRRPLSRPATMHNVAIRVMIHCEGNVKNGRHIVKKG